MKKNAAEIDYQRDMGIFIAIISAISFFIGINVGVFICWSLL